MKVDNLYFNSLDRMYSGIKKIAKAVGGTMGTGGSNAIIEAIESPGHIMTNDGYTVVQSVVLADPIEDMGRKILLESISRANKASGDGSSTTCVLTAAIIEEGRKHMGTEHPMNIKRSLEECLPIIEESIKSQTRIIDVDEVGQVATISAEDAEIGERIQTIYKEIGKDGLIYWDISKTTTDTHTIGKGITVEGAGFVSTYMCDADESGRNTNQIRIAKPYIMMTKQKITSALDLDKIGETLDGKEIKDLVIFCDDIDPVAITDIVNTRRIRGFRFAIVKMPVMWKDWWFEDLSKSTGAKIVDPAVGLPMKQLRFEHLGRAGNIIITKNDTYLDGILDVTEHIASLEAEGTDDGKLRASRLNTKTARYFVGAHSDSALSYRRLKVEDAISAAWQALNGGIVPGGGVATLNAALAVDIGDKPTIGSQILLTALMAPIKQITSNAGIVLGAGVFKDNGTTGYDTRTREMVDMFEAGIVDPANVVLNAIKNAISVAATVLTAPTLITLPREEEPDISALLSQRNVIER